MEGGEGRRGKQIEFFDFEIEVFFTSRLAPFSFHVRVLFPFLSFSFLFSSSVSNVTLSSSRLAPFR